MAQTKRPGPAPNLSRPAAEKLIRQAKKDASEAAISLCLTLMLTVLLDKFGMEEQIADVYAAWNKLSEEVLEGRVKLHELRNVLRKEYEIGI